MSEKAKKATKKRSTKKQTVPAVDTQAAPEGAQATPKGWIVGRVLKATKPIMKGDDVTGLQAALIANNYHCGEDSKSGIFGRHTAYAVRCFQAHKGLIVDGKAGKYTVTALGGTWKE